MHTMDTYQERTRRGERDVNSNWQFFLSLLWESSDRMRTCQYVQMTFNQFATDICTRINASRWIIMKEERLDFPIVNKLIVSSPPVFFSLDKVRSFRDSTEVCGCSHELSESRKRFFRNSQKADAEQTDSERKKSQKWREEDKFPLSQKLF